MDDTLVWILVIVAAVLIAGLVAWLAYRKQQSRRLRERFGPEYDRTMERAGGRREAESDLEERVARRDELELRPLSREARDTYLRQWELTQAEFVDRPGAAVEHAHALLDETMTARGYPVGEEFEERLDLISVDHPDVVEHYRFADRLHHESEAADDTAISTEDRRQALLHYRALFAHLLETTPS
jgi:hypothetical protein